MTADDADDRALLAAHVDGDRSAFGRLLERHRDRMWRIALRTLGDAEDAADAVQDAAISALRAAAGYRGDAAVTTWLHRIVVNACLDIARRRAARPTLPLLTETGSGLADPGASSVLEARETSATVVAALRRLPVDQAAAIVLVDIEGFPVREAAAMLEVAEGTVKSRCARGRAQLAVLLHDLLPGNPMPSPRVEPMSSTLTDPPSVPTATEPAPDGPSEEEPP
jgi:RNA polymerase sigma-70 factor (ECF subfamily)